MPCPICEPDSFELFISMSHIDRMVFAAYFRTRIMKQTFIIKSFDGKIYREHTFVGFCSVV